VNHSNANVNGKAELLMIQSPSHQGQQNIRKAQRQLEVVNECQLGLEAFLDISVKTYARQDIGKVKRRVVRHH
jgi:hypothetical protein